MWTDGQLHQTSYCPQKGRSVSAKWLSGTFHNSAGMRPVRLDNGASFSGTMLGYDAVADSAASR